MKNIEYKVDEAFLKSVSKNATKARQHGGINTPEPAVSLVKTQLLNDIVNELKETNSLLKELISKSTVADVTVQKPLEEEVKTEAKTTIGKK